MAFWNKKKKETAWDNSNTITIPMEKVDSIPGDKVIQQEDGSWVFFKHEGGCGFSHKETFPADQLLHLSQDKTLFVRQYVFEDREPNVDICAEKRDRKLITTEWRKTYKWKSAPAVLHDYTSISGYELTESVKVSTKEEVIETPMEWFKKNGSYKLITSESEFERYLSSTINISDWCLRKVYWSLKNYGIDIEWIEDNAKYVGEDLTQFNKMLELYDIAKGDYTLFKVLFERDLINITTTSWGGRNFYGISSK